MARKERKNELVKLVYYTYDGMRFECSGGQILAGVRQLFFSMPRQVQREVIYLQQRLAAQPVAVEPFMYALMNAGDVMDWALKKEDLDPRESDDDTLVELFTAPPAQSRQAEWQPIETAPRDCGFLGFYALHSDLWVIAPMYWSDPEFLILQFHSDNTEHSCSPTHWMPLPAAPTAQEQESGHGL